jgi:hypothetical protein
VVMRRRGMLVAAASLLAVGLIVVVVVATSGGDRASTNLPASQRDSLPVSAVDAMPATAIVHDDHAPAPRDADVADAPSRSVAETPPDASVPHTSVSPPPGKHHVRTTKQAPSSTTPDVDRGD